MWQYFQLDTTVMMMDNTVYLKKWTKVLQGNELRCYDINKTKLFLTQELTNKT